MVENKSYKTGGSAYTPGKKMESYKPKHLTAVIYSYYLPFITETKTLDHRLCSSEKCGLNCSLHVSNVTLNKLLNLYTSVSCCVHNPLSCQTLQLHGLQLTRLLCPWDYPGKSTGVGCHFLLQGYQCFFICKMRLIITYFSGCSEFL